MKKTKIAFAAMLMFAAVALIFVTHGRKDAPKAASSEKQPSPQQQKAKPQEPQKVIVTAELNVAFKE